MKFPLHIFMQCLLCVLLAAFCLAVRHRQSMAVTRAGAFGFTNNANDTFSHLAQNIYDGVCHEQH